MQQSEIILSVVSLEPQLLLFELYNNGFIHPRIFCLSLSSFSKDFARSCFCSKIFFQIPSDFLMTSKAFNRVKSVRSMLCKSSHLTGIDTVAEIIGLTEKTDAIVLPIEF